MSQELIDRIRSGDKAALGEVYDAYAPQLTIYAKRYLGPDGADDAVQETFLRLWRQPWYYKPEKGPLLAWLTRVLRNHCLDVLRKESKQESVSYEESSYEDIHSEENFASLAILSPEEQQVIILAYYKDKTQAQIAEETGIALGTVKTRLRSALKKLRSHYEV